MIVGLSWMLWSVQGVRIHEGCTLIGIYSIQEGLKISPLIVLGPQGEAHAGDISWSSEIPTLKFDS